jgi:ribosome-associated translation inhibitor RaiA
METKIEPKKVTLTVEELKAITDKIKQLEKGITAIRPEKVKEHLAKVAVIDNQPVIGWEQVKDDGTISGQGLEITLHLLNGVTKKLPYLEFIHRVPRVMVKILKTDVEEITETEFGKGGGGTTYKVDANTDKILMNEEITLAVTYRKAKAEVEIIEGDLAGTKFEIDMNYLNP